MTTYDITIKAPEVPYPGGTRQADFMRRAAGNLSDGYPIGGSNVTSTVVALLYRVAEAMDKVDPPRIPEPGLWAVVEAINGDAGGKRTWVRWPENGAGNGWVSDTGYWRCWSDLIDPALIRDGVE